MNFLSTRRRHFLAPILDLTCDARELEQAACLLERRDAILALIELIEAKSAPQGHRSMSADVQAPHGKTADLPCPSHRHRLRQHNDQSRSDRKTRRHIPQYSAVKHPRLLKPRLKM